MMTRGARAVRGTAVAGFAAFVAALAHTAGGGAAPGPVAIGLALAFSAPLAMLLAGARARTLATAVSALVTQALLHLVFAIGIGAADAPGPVTSAAHLSHVVHPGHTGSLGALGSAQPLVDHGGVAMPFTHLVAAALTVAFLVIADDVFAAFARLARGILARLSRMRIPLADLPAAPRVRAERPLATPVVLRLVDALRYRGPPAASVAR
ncbi:hypothetical protein [Agromyces larvae]|uniref:MFS transporter n=1 Tax=Agromyces larvae TaxID=2929802 RepID=A0ABY4BVJ9_9MICO|nr:hypothetical protein [Agromyces larvae]UOE42779.1 hypothetical protein MTO99_11310 [Agromyces larvae]